MSGDYVERLRARFAEYKYPLLSDDELEGVRAALDELKQRRTQQMSLDDQVFVAGWYAHAEACAYRDEMAETLAKIKADAADGGAEHG